MVIQVLVLAMVNQQDSEPVQCLQFIVQRSQEVNLPCKRCPQPQPAVNSGSTPSSQPWGGSTTETIHRKDGRPARDVVLNAVVWVILVHAHHRAQQSMGPCIFPDPELVWNTGWGELVDRSHHHQYWHLSWRPFGSQGAGVGCPAIPWGLRRETWPCSGGLRMERVWREGKQ